MGKFVIRRTGSGFKFDLKAANGETVATSEVYSSAALCRKGIESVRRCAVIAAVADVEEGQTTSNPAFVLYVDRAGQHRFRLHARNGKVIAASEGYTSKAACQRGVESIRANCVAAEITEID